jgi:hypothetical protein
VPVPAPAPDPSKTVAAKTPGDEKKPTTIKEEDLPPREGKDAKDEKGEKSGKEKSSHRSSKSSSKDSGKDAKDSKDTKKAGGGSDKPAAPIAAIAEPPRPKPGSLDALLNDAAPRASSRPKVSDDDKKSGGGSSSEGAGALPKNALVAGLNGVRPKVSNCYNQFKVPGTAMVNIVIGKSGKVTSATVTGKFAGTPTGTCVEAAVKTASFPPSDGFSTPYPFQLK